MFEQDIHKFTSGPTIKVVGIGGSGNNAINRMIVDGVQGVDFVAINTDAQVLAASRAKTKILLGKNLAKGFGAGADPEVGKKSADESREEIKQALQGADMVFIAAGMGGGTGTGAGPIVAKIAKEICALTVAIVTKPFSFEGKERSANAYNGLVELKQNVDSFIVISNDKVMESSGQIPLKEAFNEVDNVLRQCVQTIVDLVAVPAIINLDFADICRVLKNKGNALIGIGIASGDNRAQEAALAAIRSPYIESSISGATTAIVNVTGGSSFTINDANLAVQIVREAAGTDTNVIFGLSVNENLKDEMIVTVIATGFNGTIINPNFDQMERKFRQQNEVKHETLEQANNEEVVENNNIETINETSAAKIEKDYDDLPAFLRRGRM